jgi:putative spermidine/putrescine transport system substrate-binding protein
MATAATVTPALAALTEDQLAQKLASYKGKSLTIALWGGNYQKGFEEAWTKPFEERFGVKFVIDGPPTPAKVKAMIDAGNVTFDVCDFGAHRTIPLGENGYLEKLDYSIIDKTNELPNFVDDWGVGLLGGGAVIAYRSDAFPADKQPKKVADFFDLKNFPGRRSLSYQAFENIPFAIQGAGVPAKEVYPITNDKIERAYQVLDKLKDSMVIWKSGEQPVQLLGTKEVVMTSMWTSGIENASKAGIPVKVIWEGAVLSGDKWGIPKGAPNKDLAQLFIAWATRTENAWQISKYLFASSTNVEANKNVPAERAAPLPASHFSEMLPTDYQWWSKNLDAQEQRWNEWTLK